MFFWFRPALYPHILNETKAPHSKTCPVFSAVPLDLVPAPTFADVFAALAPVRTTLAFFYFYFF